MRSIYRKLQSLLLICPVNFLLATIYSSWFESVIVSAEGRVEHQKRNQTATSQWPVGFVFGVQLDYSSRLESASATDEKRVVGNTLKRSMEPSVSRFLFYI